MYIPITYWQSKDDRIAQIRGLFWATSFQGVPQTYTFTYEGASFSNTCTKIGSIAAACMDVTKFSDIIKSVQIAGGAFFCSAGTSGSSQCCINVPPNTGAEAWYIDVTYSNPDYPAFDYGTLYWSYVDQDGNIINDTITFGQTKRILAQCVPLFTRSSPVTFGRYMNWTIVEKYAGNVTPYPYNGIPVDYTITLKRERPDGGWYFNGILYSTTAFLSGFPYPTESGSYIAETATGSSLSTVIRAAYPPIDANATNNRNPPAHWITNVSPAAKGAYQLSACTGSSTLWVTLNNYTIYSTASVLKVTNPELTATSSCWSILNLTSSLSTSVALTDVNVSASYSSCASCLTGGLTSSLSVEYLLVAGGGGGGGAGRISYSGPGAGGGAGGLLSGSYTLQQTSRYDIIVGTGGVGGYPTGNTGVDGFSGSNSTAFGLVAYGGGGGQTAGAADSRTQINGGSGGGGGGSLLLDKLGGSGSIGQGNAGGRGLKGSNYYPGGGGGGAASIGTSGSLVTGSSSSYVSTAGSGGSGSAWVNGIYYSAGGAGGGAAMVTVTDMFNLSPGTAGFGGGGIGADAQFTASATSGSIYGAGGGGGATSNENIRFGASGSNGIFIIRYPGTTPLVDGGIISISGSYIYHTFTASAYIST